MSADYIREEAIKDFIADITAGRVPCGDSRIVGCWYDDLEFVHDVTLEYLKDFEVMVMLQLTYDHGDEIAVVHPFLITLPMGNDELKSHIPFLNQRLEDCIELYNENLKTKYAGLWVNPEVLYEYLLDIAYGKRDGHDYYCIGSYWADRHQFKHDIQVRANEDRTTSNGVKCVMLEVHDMVEKPSGECTRLLCTRIIRLPQDMTDSDAMARCKTMATNITARLVQYVTAYNQAIDNFAAITGDETKKIAVDSEAAKVQRSTYDFIEVDDCVVSPDDLSALMEQPMKHTSPFTLNCIEVDGTSHRIFIVTKRYHGTFALAVYESVMVSYSEMSDDWTLIMHIPICEFDDMFMIRVLCNIVTDSVRKHFEQCQKCNATDESEIIADESPAYRVASAHESIDVTTSIITPGVLSALMAAPMDHMIPYVFNEIEYGGSSHQFYMQTEPFFGTFAYGLYDGKVGACPGLELQRTLIMHIPICECDDVYMIKVLCNVITGMAYKHLAERYANKAETTAEEPAKPKYATEADFVDKLKAVVREWKAVSACYGITNSHAVSYVDEQTDFRIVYNKKTVRVSLDMVDSNTDIRIARLVEDVRKLSLDTFMDRGAMALAEYAFKVRDHYYATGEIRK